MIKYFQLSFLVSFLLLSGCNFTKPLEWIYYDRSKFTFTAEDEETDYVYLCTKGKTEEETQKRADQANNFFTKKLKIITEEFAEKFMAELKEDVESKEESFSMMNTIKITMALQKQSEKLAEDVEKQFQCLLIDTIETE